MNSKQISFSTQREAGWVMPLRAVQRLKGNWNRCTKKEGVSDDRYTQVYGVPFI